MDTNAATAASTLRIEQFPAKAEGDTPSARFQGWFDAVDAGFHGSATDAAHLAEYAKGYAADNRVLWGVYDDEPRPGVWSPDIPVATYATMVNSMNVGGGRLLDAHQITAVTVRPTHRRRGLLRRLITGDLEQAARSGLGIAALTASEATIYGRFGFGAATFTREVEVDVQERFGLRSPPAGTVEMADPASLEQLGPEIFDRFHARTPGSVARQYAYAKRISGQWGHEKPEPDKSIRAAVHYDGSGTPQGYVSYRFAGWSKEPYTMKVVDLVATTAESYRELWRYLGSIDLVQRIAWPLAPVEDPLPWALQDGRGYSAKSAEDVLWLRILDPVGALQARHYDGEGRLSLEIVDPLGLAGGRFSLEAAGGNARVQPLAPEDAVDLSVDVDVLGSLYLGGVTAGTLAAAGRLAGANDEAIRKLERIFATAARPYCITHF